MDEQQLQRDLSFVRAAVERGDAPASPAGVYYLWAAISLVGFALIDYAPAQVGLYWMFAGPLGGVASGLIGWRAARARGQSSERLGRRHWLHWTALVAAIFLLAPLVATGRIPNAEMPRLVLLLVAFAYFTGGAYLDPRLRWIAGAVAGCYLLTVVVRELPHLWTVTAVVLAASFVACGLVTSRIDRRPAGPAVP